jgi:pimeloyl-ACP methyl ester carboxylesterase
MKYFLLFLLTGNQCLSQSPINKTEIITIGGIKQYVRMKGADSSNPLLLFLHGGPGSSVMGKANQMTGKLEQQFVVVHWDQRETGETLRLNRSPVPLTLDLFYNDTHDLIDSLLHRFRQPKLYLAGYSWGSGLGFYIAGKYPQLLYAYIAISAVINQWESEHIALEMLREKMGKKAQQELAEVRIPFENAKQLYYHRKWLFRADGQRFVSLSFVQGWSNTWFDTWKAACDVNLFTSLPAIQCPVYFFAGDKDYNTNHVIARNYFDTLSAPKKDFFLFDGAGHGLPETDPGLFQDLIIQKILPETFLKSQ